MAGTGALFITWPTAFLRCAAVAGGYALALRALLIWLEKHPVHLAGLLPPLITTAKRRLTNFNTLGAFLFAFVIVMPFLPFSSRYLLDVGIMVMTYIVLAWGLNITVGFAGLLDLGYAGFYAIGAYGYALLAQYAGLGFWSALPLVAVIAVVTALLLGIPVLRLRGDYFAVVTLGFGEITRLVLINWTSLTHGPNGISGIPRPALFNLEFARQATEGMRPFHEWLGVEFSPVQRVMFLYYVILLIAVIVGYVVVRLRHLPIGCAWEAFREDEIACASLGIDRPRIKLAAYMLSAMIAAIAGAFFATRQGFVSPESFTFNESATILAIVILGGIGHPVGIALAALFIVGMPELFRGLDQYRMLAFGAGMVIIMVWRPGGLASTRQPIAKLGAGAQETP
ncbi:MAG: high-affinity branched-chain amino acid ABC transporter permease LivM [Alphaproteobacteria bacterium]|nr:high-affinity branched-chain amino acid ABC transporter permease LivM [Alphaproteobacteria bacterium]